jgi:hypothetical protein
MDFGRVVRLLSDLFGNVAFVVAVCVVLAGGAYAVWIRASIVARRMAADCLLAQRALSDSLADPRALRVRVSQLPESKLKGILSDEIGSPFELLGGFYRLGTSSQGEIEEAFHEYMDVRTLDAWPNVFVGIGLSLTFLGLSLSLWNASQGAASGDVAVVKQSVTTLLEFSATKFSTSLMALLCSIALGIALRKQRRKIEQSFRRIALELDRVLPRISLEAVAIHRLSAEYREATERAQAKAILDAFAQSTGVQRTIQLVEELREQSVEQTAQLQSFNSGLAIQLGEALDNKLQPMLASITDRLETALRDMGGTFGQSNENALRSLLESFINELRSATKADSAELQQNMQDLAGELARTSRELGERMTGVFGGMESTGERFAAIINDASQAFRVEIGQVQSDMGAGLAGTLGILAESAARSSRESEAMLEKIGAGAVGFRASIEEGATSFVNELDRGTRGIDATISRLGQSVDQLSSLVDRAALLSEVSTKRTGERIAELQATISSVDSSFKRVGEASEPFSRAAEQVRSAIDLLRVTQVGVQAKVTALQAAADSIDVASSSLSATLRQDINRMTEGLGATTDRLTSAIEAIAGESKAAGTNLSSTIKATLEEYQSRFAGIDAELAAGLKTLTESFAKTYEEMRARVSEVDDALAKSVSHLVTFSDSFGEHTEELSEAIERLPRAMAGKL